MLENHYIKMFEKFKTYTMEKYPMIKEMKLFPYSNNCLLRFKPGYDKLIVYNIHRISLYYNIDVYSYWVIDEQLFIYTRDLKESLKYV